MKNYHLINVEVNFQIALAMCQNMSAQIVFINDENENNFIKNRFSNKTIWLAIYDYAKNEKNVNYYTNESLNFTYWDSNEPNNLWQQCVIFDTSNKWKEMHCIYNTYNYYQNHYVLCEYNEITSTTTISSSTSTTTTTTITKTTTSSSTTTRTRITTTSTTTSRDSTTTLESISLTTKSSIFIEPFWSSWSSWSFCELYRQRNNSNGIEYQVLNVSCSLVCKFYLINGSFLTTFINIYVKTHLLKSKKYQ